jgi:hypothetical protein
MSKVDDVFGPIPGPLIKEWGQDVVLVQQTGSTYNSTTGTITKNTTSYNIKAVITKLKIQELGGLYQENDVKILLDPGQISNNYVTTGDYFEVPYDGGTQTMKVIDPTTYRGDNPVFYVIIARPQ